MSDSDADRTPSALARLVAPFVDRSVAERLVISVAAILLSIVVGFALVLVVGDAYLEFVGRLPYWQLSVAVLALLLVLSYLFTGMVGIAIFLAATAVGMVPVQLGARRVHLMGVLIGPLLLGL